MILEPRDLNELRAQLARCHGNHQKVSGYRLAALSRVLEHAPEDMTAAVEPGMTLAALQGQLGRQRQWLPIDPPQPDRLSVGAMLATNASGPRRFGYGTIREHLIGLSAVLADGTMVRSGGNVVKNVAGFDLGKLFVGSYGTLGVIVEARFKLRPLPEEERFVKQSFTSWADAEATLERVWAADLMPIVLDLHNLPQSPDASALTLVVGFAGSREEVAWQLESAENLGCCEPATLDYQTEFWADRHGTRPQCRALLPSRLVPVLRQLESTPFVAHAGNGIIWFRGTAPAPREEWPLDLIRRAKDTFDPNCILPALDL